MRMTRRGGQVDALVLTPESLEPRAVVGQVPPVPRPACLPHQMHLTASRLLRYSGLMNPDSVDTACGSDIPDLTLDLSLHRLVIVFSWNMRFCMLL